MGKGISGHMLPNKGATDIWLTPKYIVDALGTFDLDPCAAPYPRPWDTAKEHWTEDGLDRPWFGRVWLNPPYSEIGRWLDRLVDHGNGIAIAFARTETRWFIDKVWSKATGCLFLWGRPKFCRPDGTPGRSNSGGPVVLIAYGRTNAKILHECELAGQFVAL